MDIPWAADPHTKAKHAVYRQYLSKWMPIMMHGWGMGNITYAEGFAGPGIYLDESPGSPVIALRSLLDDATLRTAAHDLRFLFVDRESRCTTLLHDRLTAASVPVPLAKLPEHGITVDIATGTCEPTLEKLLTQHRAWGRPMLVVLDTWGGGVPIDLVRRVAGNVSSEVIITIQPQYFLRFAGSVDVEHGDRVFGGEGWRQVTDQPSFNKARWLLQHYRDTVKSVGFPHVLDFELIDSRGQALYLVFGTTHPRGLQKMKEAMWEVDDAYGVGYRDPRDPGQETLDIEVEPQTAPLRRLIIEYLAGTSDRRASVQDLRKFALFSTVYKESQVLPVVRDLVAARKLIHRGATSQVAFSDIVGLP